MKITNSPYFCSSSYNLITIYIGSYSYLDVILNRYPFLDYLANSTPVWIITGAAIVYSGVDFAIGWYESQQPPEKPMPPKFPDPGLR